LKHADASDGSTIVVLVSKSETLHSANASIVASDAFACIRIDYKLQAFDHNMAQKKPTSKHLTWELRVCCYAYSRRGGG